MTKTYYIEKDNKIIFFNKDKQVLLNTLSTQPDFSYSDIKETDKEIDNFLFTDTEEYLNDLANRKREERNYLLKEQDCWAVYDRPKNEEVENHLKYRQYLRDITKEENFPNIKILKFEDWLNKESNKE